MKTNRRQFLSLLGVGAASAPLAAKVVADNQMASLAGLNNQILAMGVQANTGVQGIPDASGNLEYVSPYIRVQQYLKLTGKLPEFVEVNLRQRAKNVSHLDPDIACKKSWSLNVKIITQRERNYQYELERLAISGKYDVAQTAFKKITGFEWPW